MELNEQLIKTGKFYNYYSGWTENELRNGIWHLADGRSIKGAYADIEMLRAELKRRGLTSEGYHNT